MEEAQVKVKIRWSKHFSTELIIQVFEEGQGCPLVFKVESENFISSIVTATLSSDISKTINITRVHSDDSFLDSTKSEIIPASGSGRRVKSLNSCLDNLLILQSPLIPTQADILNESRLTETRDQYDLSSYNRRQYQREQPSFHPSFSQFEPLNNSRSGADLLFGDSSDR